MRGCDDDCLMGFGASEPHLLCLLAFSRNIEGWTAIATREPVRPRSSECFVLHLLRDATKAFVFHGRLASVHPAPY